MLQLFLTHLQGYKRQAVKAPILIVLEVICELLLPLTSPGNIFVNDQVYPLRRGTLYLIGENTLHRTIATGFHARYVLHVSRKTLSDLSTPCLLYTSPSPRDRG